MAGRASGGFARGRGNMVTRKAFVRPIFRRAPHFRRRSKTASASCARRCPALYERRFRSRRACRGQPHGVTKTGAKSAGRTKMTRSVSSMMDVGRHDFGVRNGGDRKIRRREYRANRVVRFSELRGPLLNSLWSRDICARRFSLEKLRCRLPDCDRWAAPDLTTARVGRSLQRSGAE